MDSATPLKFDCDFLATPASSISKKAHRLSKAMPALLKVELLPTGHILNDASDRSRSLLNVQIYLFPDENKTERYSKRPFCMKDKLLILCYVVVIVNLSNQGMYTHSFRFKGNHAHLFEAMETRNVMIKADINGTELFICSSKLLDKPSQCMPTVLLQIFLFVHKFSVVLRIKSVLCLQLPSIRRRKQKTSSGVFFPIP